MKMTKELLEQLGSCGDYVRTFRRLFPTSEFPDGVEINEDVCRAQANEFPWYWAVEQMLSREGNDECVRVRNELEAELNELHQELATAKEVWKERYDEQYLEPSWDTSSEARDAYREITDAWNAQQRERGLTGNQMEARAFGRVFDSRPELRSAKIERARERAVEQAEHATIAAYTDLNARLTRKRAQLAELTQLVPRLEAEEVELRAKYLPAKARQQSAQAALLADRATEATRLAESAQARAAEAQAEAEKLAAEAAAITTANDDATTTTDDTASAATASETPSSEQ